MSFLSFHVTKIYDFFAMHKINLSQTLACDGLREKEWFCVDLRGSFRTRSARKTIELLNCSRRTN